MTINLNSIDRAIAAIEVELDTAIIESQAKVVIAVDQAVVLGTPVATGRARGNWRVTIGSPAVGYERERFSPSGQESIQEALSVSSAIVPGNDVWISNNLPYIGALNDGHSKQAPAGFIEKAVQAAVSAFE